MLTIGTCRVCGTGPLGLRVCGGCQKVVVLCDECDTSWPDADPATPPTFASEEGMPCPHCQSSLWEETSTWATREEAIETEWLVEALLTLEEGESFEPKR